MSVCVKDVCFSYGERTVLDHVSFTVEGGQLVSLLGPNGVGKSTLFKCILGLIRQHAGFIEIEGINAAHADQRTLARLVAYIPQSHYPVFNFSVLDMVLMGTASRISAFSTPGRDEVEVAMAALARLNIEHFAGRDYMRISGGERQLVLIARALAQQSRILIMDEPTANLDYGNQMRVLTSIRKLAGEGYTIIQSSHNPEQSYLFSHRILAMHGGRIIADGPPQSVITGEIIGMLYGIDTQMKSLHGDRIRVCVPLHLMGEHGDDSVHQAQAGFTK